MKVSVRIPAAAVTVAVVAALTACGGTSADPVATTDATPTTSPAASPPAAHIGDRFATGPDGGTFRVGFEPGLPRSIPPGEYRLTFSIDDSTGERYTTGLWIRCSDLPCEPGGDPESVNDSGIVGTDRRTGEARSQSVAGDGTVTEHGTTLRLDRTDGAVWFRHLSLQLLSFG